MQGHSASEHAQSYAQRVRDLSVLSRATGDSVTERELFYPAVSSELADRKLQLIDSIH
jgi:hypothetical protein